MQKELQTFTNWLEKDLTHFVALVEEGSVAAGDPWQEGFSDHDLQVIVTSSKDTESKAIYNFLEKNPLGNEYLVTVRLADDYSHGDSLNDISLKFRSVTLAGEDVVASKVLPSRDKALQIGRSGLVDLRERFDRRLLNLSHWLEDYAQKKNYEIFKNFFVYGAAYLYGKTGHYPISRSKVASKLPDQLAAQKILSVTNNILSASKDDQKSAIEASFNLINDLIKK
jgi:hypothetical protein